MKLRSITLHNYRKFRHAELEIPEGIMAIIGNNGSGKSTIIEAIGWAIYGTVVARTKKENIRRQEAAPADDCYVTLHFEVGDDLYEVTRIMTGSNLTTDAHVKVNGVVVASSASGTTRMLEKKLGMDYDSFFTSVIARQKEINALSSKTPGERKQSMLRMLSIDAIEEAVRRVREDKKNKEQIIDAVQNALMSMDDLNQNQQVAQEEKEALSEQLREMNSALSSLERKVNQLAEQRTAIQKKQEQYNQLEKDRSKVQERLRNTSSRLEEKIAEYQALQAKKEHLDTLAPKEQELEETKRYKEQLDEQRERYLTSQQLVENITSLQLQLEQKRQTIKQVQQQLKDKDEIESQLDQLRKQEQNIAVERKEKESASKIAQVHIKTVQRGRKELEEKKDTIEQQGPESDCPTCGRPLEEHFEDLMTEYNTAIENEDNKIKMLNNNLTEFEAAIQELKEKEKEAQEQRRVIEQRWEVLKNEEQRLVHLKETEQELADAKEEKDQRIKNLGKIVFNQQIYATIQKKVEELQKVKETIIGLRSEVKRLSDIQETVGKLQEKEVTINNQLNSIQQDMQGLNFNHEQFKSLEQLHEETREQTQQQRERRIDLSKDLEHIEETLGRLTKDLAEQQRKRQEITEMRREAQQLDMLAGGRDTGLLNDFKRYLISRIGPLLAYYASSFFDVFTEGKYKQMEIDDNYDIYIYDQDEKFSINRFSGGEEDLANLALRLAISQVIAERSGGVDFHFIVLDEIFGSQDSQRRHNVLHTLGELSSQFQQVILITHIEEIKDTMQHVIRTVEDEEGVSHVQVE